MKPRHTIKATDRQLKTLCAAISHWLDHMRNGEDPLDRSSAGESEEEKHGRNSYLNISEVETLENNLLLMTTGKSRARMARM